MPIGTMTLYVRPMAVLLFTSNPLLHALNGWFTEGFDTKDLQEAKALLDKLVCMRV